MTDDLFALPHYAAFMSVNPVRNYTFIIRSQAEYSELSQSMSVRHILEIPTTGKHLGFVDAEALLATLRKELTKLHGHDLSITNEKEEKT